MLQFAGLQIVGGAFGASVEGAAEPCVHHGGAYVFVAHELLELAWIGVSIEEVGGETMPQRVSGALLGDAGGADRPLDAALHGGFVQMMTAPLPGFPAPVDPGGWEYPLVAPLA